ncbi:unnamed protein product [Parnassius apollo]|uniref:(apollo) hypothetical protein n=1 Tax=Parnassius apollo TaxID=110799 RepID=A0A8S3VXP7_PARAO|nr:unnamed protein product [Parnassius apollo]
MNEPQKEWINKSIITEINERNVMWTEQQNNPEREELREKFITKRHKIIKLIRETKKSYYKKEFDKYSGKPKKLWNLLNTLTNNKFKQRCAPPKLIVNSIEVTDPHEICNIFNNFFATIGPYLADEIPIQFHVNYTHALPKPLLQNLQMNSLEPCTEEEILNIINKLDSNSSVGLDGVSTKVF